MPKMTNLSEKPNESLRHHVSFSGDISLLYIELN